MNNEDKSETRYIWIMTFIMIIGIFILACFSGSAHAACFTVRGQVKCTPEPNDVRNDYNSLKLYTPQGQYRGNVNSNQLDPNSISNPLGKYGSNLSPYSVNNQFAQPSYIGE